MSAGSTLSDTPLLSDTEVAAAIVHLDTEGYCLLKNRIPREVPMHTTPPVALIDGFALGTNHVGPIFGFCLEYLRHCSEDPNNGPPYT